MSNIYRMKQEICEIGDRLYKRGFAAANDGNITYRVSENEFLCTPTMHCKGFMKPDDISVIDGEGKQLSGNKKRSSEALLHLEIMKARPDVKSVVHCHPPHATAFAVARQAIPQCILPEVELFLGDVPITKYETPGGKAFAETILPFVKRANVVILANHGTVSWGENVERAYWWTEILDSYCRILLLAKQIGHIEYLPADKSLELVELKKHWGFTDPRHEEGFQSCNVCANDVGRVNWTESGIQTGAFGAPAWAAPASGPSKPAVADEDALVQAITERVLAALQTA